MSNKSYTNILANFNTGIFKNPITKCILLIYFKYFCILTFALSVQLRNRLYISFFTSWIQIRFLHSDPDAGGLPKYGSVQIRIQKTLYTIYRYLACT